MVKLSEKKTDDAKGKKKDPNERKWLVVYTKARAEKKVNDRLNEEGIKTYLPLYKTIRKWKDRKKKVELPLFNSYVFVHVNEQERMKVLSVEGVANFIYYLKKPAVVRDREIEAVKLFLSKTEGMKIDVRIGNIKIGQQVQIVSGPMEGVFGKVIRIGKGKLVLRIEQLSLEMTAEVDWGAVKYVQNEKKQNK
jgi:transcription antitermination factor NusG